MRFCKPNVPTSSQIKGANALRNGSFNARSDSIPLFERLGLLALARRLNGLKLRLWTHYELAWIGDGSGTLAAAGTRRTILFTKLDPNHPCDRTILLVLPLAAHLRFCSGSL